MQGKKVNPQENDVRHFLVVTNNNLWNIYSVTDPPRYVTVTAAAAVDISAVM